MSNVAFRTRHSFRSLSINDGCLLGFCVGDVQQTASCLVPDATSSMACFLFFRILRSFYGKKTWVFCKMDLGSRTRCACSYMTQFISPMVSADPPAQIGVPLTCIQRKECEPGNT